MRRLPQGAGEALTGGRTGRVLSRETKILRDADAVEVSGRRHPGRRHRETLRSPAWSESPRMSGHTSRENRESPWSPVVDGTAGGAGGKTISRLDAAAALIFRLPDTIRRCKGAGQIEACDLLTLRRGSLEACL